MAKKEKLGVSHNHSTPSTVILRKGLIFMTITIFMTTIIFITMTFDNFCKTLNCYDWILITLVPEHFYF